MKLLKLKKNTVLPYVVSNIDQSKNGKIFRVGEKMAKNIDGQLYLIKSKDQLHFGQFLPSARILYQTDDGERLHH